MMSWITRALEALNWGQSAYQVLDREGEYDLVDVEGYDDPGLVGSLGDQRIQGQIIVRRKKQQEDGPQERGLKLW